eukprot:9293971-Prorocentrum_lima.AAC.1
MWAPPRDTRLGPDSGLHGACKGLVPLRERPPGNDVPRWLGQAGLPGSEWGCLYTASPLRVFGHSMEARL